LRAPNGTLPTWCEPQAYTRYCKKLSDAGGGGQRLRMGPLLLGTPFRECAQLARPDLAQQVDGGVRAAEPLALAVGGRALADLADVVLDAHDVGPVLELVHVALAAQDGSDHVVRRRLHGGPARPLLCPVALRRLAREVHQRHGGAQMALV